MLQNKKTSTYVYYTNMSMCLPNLKKTILISRLTVHKERLGYLSACAVVLQSSLPTHVFVAVIQAELCCINCTRAL